MNRTKFYNSVVVDGITELDFLHNPLSSMELRYEPTYYRTTDTDVMRPDLISYKCYGSVDFWWVLMLVNDIDNPLLDLVSGTILIVPNLLDVYDFRRRYKV
jgi:hypothetical protein